MLSHDFILVDNIPPVIRYSNYDRATMTRISDDFMLKYWNEVFGTVDVYADYSGNLKHGLAYHGTSILTPPMSQKLLDKLLLVNEQGEDYCKLESILSMSTQTERYVIHFGI